MNLQTKTTLLAVTLSVAMVLLISVVSLIFFRQFSLETAKDHVRSVAEVVRVSLTESMINEVIDQRQQFLQRLANVEGFVGARVVRGLGVIGQFGKGLNDEQAIDNIELRVLETGVSYFNVSEENSNPVFRGTIAFVANDLGTPNCLQCHSVAKGTVLGAITVHLSMSHLKNKALGTIGVMMVIVVLFGVMVALLFRWQISKIVLVAQGVHEVVSKAKDGDFRGRLDYHGTDELGWISRDLNSLMIRLNEDLGAISYNVSKLMNYELTGNTNLITTTTEMVETLLDVAQFKQAVEEDRTVQEVYFRIGRVLENQFWVTKYSIYEVLSESNQIKPVMVDGSMDGTFHWCHERVANQADFCRANRTGNVVDSFENIHICPQFTCAEDSGMEHLCIPVLHSGRVGTVIQIVAERKVGHLYQLVLPFIQVYLRESASTVEVKRLLDTLRESALRDPLTDLHNRRFLEEYVETLEAATRRQKHRLSVLLLDLDHFKEVNDTWGHDAGDIVLKGLARVLGAQVVRTSDLVIRFGGEEFLVILQESEAATGPTMAERIRLAVENLRIPITGDVLKRTISIGLASFPDDGNDIWQVIKCADEALYQAKDSGRNRVVIYSKNPPLET